jgi:hypothetical protein
MITELRRHPQKTSRPRFHHWRVSSRPLIHHIFTPLKSSCNITLGSMELLGNAFPPESKAAWMTVRVPGCL